MLPFQGELGELGEKPEVAWSDQVNQVDEETMAFLQSPRLCWMTLGNSRSLTTPHKDTHEGGPCLLQKVGRITG